MKGVFCPVLLQIQGNVGDAREDFGAPPRTDATGFSIHRVRCYSSCIIQSVRLMPPNTIYQYDDHLLWRGFFCALYTFSPPLFPLSSACCSVLTCLFSYVIRHTSQSWCNRSCSCGYIWFLFARRGNRHRAMPIKARWMLWSTVTLPSQEFETISCLSFVTDSALDDFVLMHCVFIPNSQLCAVLMAQYPFITSLWDQPEKYKQALHFGSPLLFVWSLTAVYLPCPGFSGLWAGKEGLHAEQQAQGDPPGDAVGCCTWRSPSGGGSLDNLPWGQFTDINNYITTVITTVKNTV